MTTPLQKAAHTLLERWENPEYSLSYLVKQLLNLRKALDAELQQSVEPAASLSLFNGRKRAHPQPPTDKDIENGWKPLYLHPPQQAKLSVPVTANDDEVICPKCCNQFRAIPIGVQQLMLNAGFEPPFKHPPQHAAQNSISCEIEVAQVRWEGDKLLATPKFSPQQAVTSGERAELIARLIRKANAWDYLHPHAKRPNDCRDAADMLEAGAQQAYDQQAMELCNVCGWKALIPGEPCLVCNMQLTQVNPIDAANLVESHQIKEMFEADAQQAKQVPMTQPEKQRLWNDACYDNRSSTTDAAMDYASMIEKHHSIGGET